MSSIPTLPQSQYPAPAWPSPILKVMGGRSQRGSYAGFPLGYRWLTAIDTKSGTPMSADWCYVGDTVPVAGWRFRDVHPERALEARSGDHHEVIKPRNVSGNGALPALNWSAFAALRDTGDVVPWGASGVGGVASDDIAALTDLVDIVGSGLAFAALRSNGGVVNWGEVTGADMVPLPTITDGVKIVGSLGAFAALRANRQVVTWGHVNYGAEQPALDDVVDIANAGYGFAARLGDGRVTSWGNAGNVPPDIEALTDIVEVIGSESAFAALRANGSVVAWGDPGFGGVLTAEIASLDDIVEISSTARAFAVLRKNGSVAAWGDADHGGHPGIQITGLTDVIEVVGNSAAFVALRENGRVEAWGHPDEGGLLAADSPIRNLDTIVQVAGSGGAFAVLPADGWQVMAWGNPKHGGYYEDNGIIRQGRALYVTTFGFAALTDQAMISTWGDGENGGDSDAVIDELVTRVGYLQT